MKSTIRVLLLSALCLTAGLCGCSQRNGVRLEKVASSLKENLSLGERSQRSQLPIHRIVPLWRAARGRDMAGLPCRGVAGQILFFTAESETPVKLEGDGDVAIYVFDDQGPPEERGKPLHKFQFPLAVWNKYLQENGTLGPSYYVFIPYTRKVVKQAKMTLAVRLQSKEGRLIALSELPTVTLPGPKPVDSSVGRNLSSQRPTGKTKATTLNQQFFKFGKDRELRRQAMQQGTRVSTRDSAVRHASGISEMPPRREAIPRVDRVRHILNELSRESRSSRHAVNPLLAEPGDAPPLGRSFRLRRASRDESVPRREADNRTPALLEQPRMSLKAFPEAADIRRHSRGGFKTNTPGVAGSEAQRMALRSQHRAFPLVRPGHPHTSFETTSKQPDTPPRPASRDDRSQVGLFANNERWRTIDRGFNGRAKVGEVVNADARQTEHGTYADRTKTPHPLLDERAAGTGR